MPVVRARRLSEEIGLDNVWVADATRQRTGTFKDFEADVIIALSVALGLSTISVHSTGNTALAYREAGIVAGLPCVSYVPLANMRKMRGATPSAQHPIIAIDAPYSQVSVIAKNHARVNGFTHMAPLPWKLEGKAAIAWAIAEACPQARVIVQTVAGGYGPLGYELGFSRARMTGWGAAAPVVSERHYLLTQPSDADALTRSWTTGELPTGLSADPFEPTLQSTNPASTLPLLRRALATETTMFESVPTAEVELGVRRFAEALREVDIDLDPSREKSTFIALAGMARARDALASWRGPVVVVVSGARASAPDVVEPDFVLNARGLEVAR